jgi:hypothetical protein
MQRIQHIGVAVSNNASPTSPRAIRTEAETNLRLTLPWPGCVVEVGCWRIGQSKCCARCVSAGWLNGGVESEASWGDVGSHRVGTSGYSILADAIANSGRPFSRSGRFRRNCVAWPASSCKHCRSRASRAGVPTDYELQDRQGQPFHVLSWGKPIREELS